MLTLVVVGLAGAIIIGVAYEVAMHIADRDDEEVRQLHDCVKSGCWELRDAGVAVHTPRTPRQSGKVPPT